MTATKALRIAVIAGAALFIGLWIVSLNGMLMSKR